MTANPTLREQIFGSPGYSASLRFSDSELAMLRAAIEEQWIGTIRARYPEHAQRFQEAGLARYHTLAHLVDHETLWPKETRLLAQAVVDKVVAFATLGRLAEELGPFTISDVVYGDTIEEGRREVYWRIVRPNVETDVGPLHADKWFHSVLGGEGGMFPQGVRTVKIWIPIFCEPGRNGLMVVPDSHLRDWPHQYVNKGGFLKPDLEEGFEYPAGQLVPTEPGTLLMFDEALLHGGAVNRGETTRVSAEITLVIGESSPGARLN